MKVLTIRDIKAEANMPVFCMRSRGEAIRAFGDACKKSDGSPLSVHPEDYVLFEVGEFDEVTGLINAYTSPVSVCLGTDFMKTLEPVPSAEEC